MARGVVVMNRREEDRAAQLGAKQGPGRGGESEQGLGTGRWWRASDWEPGELRDGFPLGASKYAMCDLCQRFWKKESPSRISIHLTVCP